MGKKADTSRAIQRALGMITLYFLIIAIPLGAYLYFTSSQEKYFTAWRFRQLNAVSTEMVDRVKLIGQLLSYHDFSPTGDKHKTNWPAWLHGLKISAQEPISLFDLHSSFPEKFKSEYKRLRKQLDNPPQSHGKTEFLATELNGLYRDLDQVIGTLNAHIDCINHRSRTTKPLIKLHDAESPASLQINWSGCADPVDISSVATALQKLRLSGKPTGDFNIAASLNNLHELDSRPIRHFLEKAGAKHRAAMLETSSTQKDESQVHPDKSKQCTTAWERDLLPLAKAKFCADPALFKGWHISTDLYTLIPDQRDNNHKFDDLFVVDSENRIISKPSPILGGSIPDQNSNQSQTKITEQTVPENGSNNGLLALTENIDAIGDERYENKRLLKANGKDYYLFCQPLHLLVNHSQHLGLCGLIEKTRFDERVGEVSPRQVSLFLLVLLLSFALLPFLKLSLISREETFRKRDFAAVRLAMILGGAVLTVLVMDVIAYRYFLLEIDSVSKQIAKQIESEVHDEIDDLYNVTQAYATHFNCLNRAPFPGLNNLENQGDQQKCNPPTTTNSTQLLGTFRECKYDQNSVTNQTSLIHPPVHYYSDAIDRSTRTHQSIVPPGYEVLIATDKNGRQLGPVITSRKGMWLGVPADVSTRPYFKQAINTEAGAIQENGDLAYALQRIRERSIGVKLTALAIPFGKKQYSASAENAIELEPGMIFATRHIYSLFKPILPPGFGFAVLDKRTKQLIYHSDDELSLVEDMLGEVDPSHALKLLDDNDSEPQMVRYHGRKHRVSVTKIDSLNGHLVIFYDLELAQIMTYQTVILALCLLATYLLALVFWGTMVQKLVQAIRGDVQFAIWLWPHYSLNERYGLAALGQLLVFIMALSIYINFPNDYLIAAILILVPLLVMGGQASLLGFFSKKTFTGKQLVNTNGQPPPPLKKLRFLACTAIYLINLGLLPAFIIFNITQSATVNNLMNAWHFDMRYKGQSRIEIIKDDLIRINKDTYSHDNKLGKIPGNYLKSLCNTDKMVPYHFCDLNYSGSLADSFTALIPTWNSATAFLDSHYALPKSSVTSKRENESVSTNKNQLFFPNILSSNDLFLTNTDNNDNDNTYITLITIAAFISLIIVGGIIVVFIPWVAKKLLGTSLQTPLPLQEITSIQISLDRSTTLIRAKPGFAKDFIDFLNKQGEKRNYIHINIGLDQWNSEMRLTKLTEDLLDRGDFFILEAFDARLTDGNFLSAKLELLEAIHRRGKHALILTDVALPYRITIYEGVNSEALLTRTETQRWGSVLSHYTKIRQLPNATVRSLIGLPLPPSLRLPLSLARECYWDPVLSDIVVTNWQNNTYISKNIKDLSCHFTGYDELSSRWVADIGRARFREIWALSTQREKLVLYRIASGTLLNPANSDIVEHLIQRRLLIRWPDFQIASASFRNFILEAESAQTFQGWESQSKTGLWSNIQRPIAVLFVAILALLISTQSGASQALVAIITAFAGGLPILSLFFGRTPTTGSS